MQADAHTSLAALRRLVHAAFTVAALAVAALALFSPAPATAAPSDPNDVPVGDVRTPNLPVTALTRVSIEKRARDAGKRWDPQLDRYDDAYVKPSGWTLALDACASSPGTGPSGVPFTMRDYEWRIEPLDGQNVAPIAKSGSSCQEWVTLRTLGRWRFTLTTRSSNGRSARGSTDRRFRDLVVVAFGDSFTSGEGNMELVTQTPTRTVRRWSDRQCHRSEHSWAMRAARKLEDEATSVTFLNFACSGATTTDLFQGGYKGIAPTSSDRRLKAQLAQARDALGDPLVRDTRPVHSVLMSAGVNDADFSSTLIDCAKLSAPDGVPVLGGLDPLVDNPCDNVGSTRGVRTELSLLKAKYDRVDAAFAANLKVSPAAVRLAEYPSRLMTDEHDRHGGCGIFEGLSSSEARWISDRGDELGATMRAAVGRNGWGYLGGVRDVFRGHGYCADGESWFRGFKDSVQIQHNVDGTAHPIARGHAKIAQLALRTIPVEPVEPAAPARVKFEFLRVRVGDPRGEVVGTPRGGPGAIRARFGVEWYGNGSVVTNQGQRIQLGRWMPVPEAERTRIVETRGNTASVTLDMSLPSLKIEHPNSPKGFIVTGPRRVHLDAIHRRAEGWRTGTHVLGGDKSVQVEYRVTRELYNPDLLSRPD